MNMQKFTRYNGDHVHHLSLLAYNCKHFTKHLTESKAQYSEIWILFRVHIDLRSKVNTGEITRMHWGSFPFKISESIRWATRVSCFWHFNGTRLKAVVSPKQFYFLKTYVMNFKKIHVLTDSGGRSVRRGNKLQTVSSGYTWLTSCMPISCPTFWLTRPWAACVLAVLIIPGISFFHVSKTETP